MIDGADFQMTPVEYGELRGRVFGFENAMRDLRSDIERRFTTLSGIVNDLNVTVIEKSRPQYLVISSLASIFLVVSGAIWGLAVQPIKDSIVDIRHTMETIVPREVHLKQWAVYEKELDRLGALITLMEKTKMDRASMDAMRADINSKIEELNGRLKRQR
jgi:hypothetical protein